MKFHTKYFIREYFRLRVLVFCFVFSGFLFFTHGTSHYVNKNANGSNNGTNWANAWESFAAINWSTVQPGDFIYISGGTDSTVYNETMTVNASGSPGNFIVITKGKESGHNGKVILDGSGTIQYGIVISKSAGLSYLKLADLYFRNYEQAVRVLDAANVIYLDSLNIRGQWGQGAITLSGWNSNGDPTLIDSIFIRYCDIRSDIQVDAQTDNIFIQYANNVFIFNNHIEQLNTTGAQHIDCIQTANSLGSYYIANNYVKNMKYTNSQAMMLNHPNPGYRGVLYNNVVTGVARLTVASNSYGGMEDFYCINNTLYINHPTGMSILSIWDSIAVVKNNIVIAPNSIVGALTADINTRGDRYNYNCYNSPDIRYALVIGTSGHTQAYWQASPYLQDLNSKFFTDPLFNDPSSGDFSLSMNSPAIGAGEDLQSLIESFGLEWKSINGIPRGNSPSMGAYEIAQGGGGNNPPTQPSNPEPSNGAINQSTNTALMWSCADPDGDPLTYDVYFGTANNPPLVAGNQTSTSYNPGQLNNNTTYYWKIVAKDNQGASTVGPLWSFTTVDQNDTTPPELEGAQLADSVTVLVTFSEEMDPATIEIKDNYSINNNITVDSVTVLPGNKRVILNTTGHTPGLLYTLSANNVKDISGNLIARNKNTVIYHAVIKKKYPVIQADGQWYQNFTPQKAIDGNPDTTSDSRWGGVVNLPDSIVFDLGRVYTIDETHFSFYRWNKGRIYNYSIMISIDGISWIKVVDNQASFLREWTVDAFAQTEGRYIKLVVLSCNESQFAGLWEAEILGPLDITGVDYGNQAPSEFRLEQNFPNPFNPATTINFSIPSDQQVKISIYNTLGQLIKSLVNQFYTSGSHSVTFDASDLPSGVYIYRLESKSYNESKKMILMK